MGEEEKEEKELVTCGHRIRENKLRHPEVVPVNQLVQLIMWDSLIAFSTTAEPEASHYTINLLLVRISRTNRYKLHSQREKPAPQHVATETLNRKPPLPPGRLSDRNPVGHQDRGMNDSGAANKLTTFGPLANSRTGNVVTSPRTDSTTATPSGTQSQVRPLNVFQPNDPIRSEACSPDHLPHHDFDRQTSTVDNNQPDRQFKATPDAYSDYGDAARVPGNTAPWPSTINNYQDYHPQGVLQRAAIPDQRNAQSVTSNQEGQQEDFASASSGVNSHLQPASSVTSQSSKYQGAPTMPRDASRSQPISQVPRFKSTRFADQDQSLDVASGKTPSRDPDAVKGVDSYNDTDNILNDNFLTSRAPHQSHAPPPASNAYQAHPKILDTTNAGRQQSCQRGDAADESSKYPAVAEVRDSPPLLPPPDEYLIGFSDTQLQFINWQHPQQAMDHEQIPARRGFNDLDDGGYATGSTRGGSHPECDQHTATVTRSTTDDTVVDETNNNNQLGSSSRSDSLRLGTSRSRTS
jgi:hypothetical protein